MESADLIATIALLVSLIALLITLIQLLQSSALTAEGWRQCNATNMGKWSVFSRRKWLWSELRCEVRFTTPEIRLIVYDEQYYPFVKRNDNDRLLQELSDRQIFEPHSTFSIPESLLARYALHVLGFNSLPNDIEHDWKLESTKLRSKSGREVSVPEYEARQTTALYSRAWFFALSCLRWMRGYHFNFQPQHLSRYNKRSGHIAITWDSLLLHLWRYQQETFGGTPSSPVGPHAAEVGPLCSNETIICLELQRQSWDFLPPEVVRPLARSTLGTIVILARRLDMRWRSFDMSRDQYRAEGNGCSLSATSTRGLGLVFRFDTRSYRKPPQLLCSVNADKSYFGILVGDSELGVPDHPLVGADCQPDIDAFIRAELGEEPMELRSTLLFWGRIVPNDIIALMCPFMPLCASPTPRIFTVLGSRGRFEIFFKVSIFRAYALDTDLRQELNRRLKDIMVEKFPSDKCLQFGCPSLDVATAEVSLQKLFEDHWRNITRVGQMNDARRMNSEDPPNMSPPWTQTENLRRIHRTTTKYFLEHLADDSRTGGDPSSFFITTFMDLVRAHMKLVSHCILKWHNQTPEGQEKKKNRRTNHAAGDLRDGWATLLGFCHALQKNLGVYRTSLRDISNHYDQVSDELLDRFWWMLMARCVAWHQSVHVVYGGTGSMVPSWVYGSEMSVWIE